MELLNLIETQWSICARCTDREDDGDGCKHYKHCLEQLKQKDKERNINQ